MDKYAVFGNPISQSKSPLVHSLFAKETDQNMQYHAIKTTEAEFRKTLDQFFLDGAKGCNITAPFKELAFDYADRLSERAKLAGSVNTLKLADHGIILGDNTDGDGLIKDLQRQGIDLKGKSILLVGAGGAARGVCESILTKKPTKLTITNRTLSKAQKLCHIFSSLGYVHALSYSELSPEYDLIINATSTTLSGELPPLKETLIQNNTVTYDLSYSREKTPFNKWAEKNGAKRSFDGLGMLVGQAAESFFLWRNIRPNEDEVLNFLRKEL